MVMGFFFGGNIFYYECFSVWILLMVVRVAELMCS